MNEQIRIEEKAHFYTEKKDVVEQYAKEKEKGGYTVKIHETNPLGYVVVSNLWICMSEKGDDYESC